VEEREREVVAREKKMRERGGGTWGGGGARGALGAGSGRVVGQVGPRAGPKIHCSH
jgi:hypothetical protein